LTNKRIVIFGWTHSVHVQRWARGLSQRGYKIKVVSLDGNPLPEIETCVLPRSGKWSYFTQTSHAVREAREFAPDLVHVHYAGGFGLWGVRTGIKPTVVSVWGSDLIGYRPRWLYNSLLRFVLKRTTHVTATGQFLKETTCRICPTVCDKMSIIPFGVDIPENIESPPSEPLRICYIKGHRSKYGPDVLLKAMSEVKKTVPGVTLSFAGRGEQTVKLKKMVSALGLEDTVHFVGFVQRDRIYPFLQEHHLMVMPSLTEAFGVAALEASACGRPVIASNVGGVPEVVLDGTTGILVPPKDPHKLAEAIINLAQDARAREKMGKAGYEFVKQRYSWERSLDMMGDLYERLINEKPSR
jgi:glycosyltransferase involved in cell wall biosynthesis